MVEPRYVLFIQFFFVMTLSVIHFVSVLKEVEGGGGGAGGLGRMELRESSDGQLCELCEHLPGSYCCGPGSSPGVNAISLIRNRPL